MDSANGVHARPASDSDKFPHLLASMFAASFVSVFGKKVASKLV